MEKILMIDIAKQTGTKAGSLAKQRNYNDIVDYLDKQWAVPPSPSLERMKQLDQAFGSLSQKLNAILVAGTNGKSLTVHFTAKLFKEENLKVGAFYAPHILTYNERFTINQETISNKIFTEIGNEVITMAESLGINAHSQELLTMMALVYFVHQGVDVAVLEVDEGGLYNPVNICHAKVVTITRVTPFHITTTQEQLNDMTKDIMGIVKQGTYIVSGDQSKNTLQLMQELTQKQGGHWAMPIRKLVSLSYPFEQLHGRCAALAERLAQMYVEKFLNKGATILNDSLLTKQKGQRGRPTIEAKRKSELYPRKTLEHHWKETVNELPARFQLLDKEKPTLLLDTANNIDAFKNVLLGIRLLHYQRPLKGLTIIVGAAHNTLHNEEFLKLIRYFFKKTSGQLFLCPLGVTIPSVQESISWDVEQVANDIKSMKIKARSFKTFEEAFDAAKKSVDERHGLVVITGSQSIIHNYWHQKGIKKF
jgi:dihydrofolate synthase / folylpolyglutamate synthase